MEQRTTLKDWLVARVEVDHWWVREQLLHEVERLELVIAESVEKLRFPPEEGWSVYTDRGRLAAQRLDELFRAMGALLAGASLAEIPIPSWMISEQLSLPEPVEEKTTPPTGERPWEVLGITETMWYRPLWDVLPLGRNAVRSLQRYMKTANIDAGPVVRLFNLKGWNRTVNGIGLGLLELLRASLEEAGYPVPGK